MPFFLLSTFACILPPEQPKPSVIRAEELDLVSTIARGKRYSLSGRADLAEKEFRLALLERPEMHSLHNDLGYVLFAQNRFAEAKASILEALRLEPRNIAARESLAHILYRQGDVYGAIRQYRTSLLTLDVEDPIVLQEILGSRTGAMDYVRMNRNLATAYYAIGELDEAMCHSALARSLVASQAQTGQNARLLLSLEHSAQAVAELRQVIVATGGEVSPKLMLDYGIALYAENEYPLALAAFSRVLSSLVAEAKDRRSARLFKLSILMTEGRPAERSALKESLFEEDEDLCEIVVIDEEYWPLKLILLIEELQTKMCSDEFESLFKADVE
jgi:tetratricopeptide (TPR) repeat protein